MSTTAGMRFALITPEGVVAAQAGFTEADALAPRGGLIDQLANQIAAREREGLTERQAAKWLAFGTAERAQAAAVHGDDIVSDMWAYTTDLLHNAFMSCRDTALLNGWSIQIAREHSAPDSALPVVAAEHDGSADRR